MFISKVVTLYSLDFKRKVSMKLLIIFLLFFIFTSPAYAGELTGKASWYSTTGCLGCSPNLTMANGQKLDDTKLTVALTPLMVKQHKLMNEYIGIVNPKNKKSVIVQVTDTGGFAKYNRVA